MKRTSSGTPPRSPSPDRGANADRRKAAPITRTTRVRAEWSAMHHPGRPTVAVLLVGTGEQDATHHQLVAWRRRAREVEYNYCVIEAGDASEEVSACAELLMRQLPADATVVVLQADPDVPADEVERAQDALSHAGLARRSLGPVIAGEGDTRGLPAFPSELELLRAALRDIGELARGEGIDAHAEAAFEARQRPIMQSQRQQQISQIATLEKQVEAHTQVVIALGRRLAIELPVQEPLPAPPRAFTQLIDRLQFTPHWQARASTPQAARLMSLLLRVGREATSKPDSPQQFAVEEIVRSMGSTASALGAVLAAVDRWPADGSDQALLAVLLRALKEHDVASGAFDDDPVYAPRAAARCVLLHGELQALAASALNTLGNARVRNLGYESRLQDYFEQAQLALLLDLEEALPDAQALSTPGFDSVAGIVFAAWLQSRQHADEALDAFMAGWTPWQNMVERLTSQGRWPPEAQSTDSE